MEGDAAGRQEVCVCVCGGGGAGREEPSDSLLAQQQTKRSFQSKIH